MGDIFVSGIVTGTDEESNDRVAKGGHIRVSNPPRRWFYKARARIHKASQIADLGFVRIIL
jgi:hypothetical protein